MLGRPGAAMHQLQLVLLLLNLALLLSPFSSFDTGGFIQSFSKSCRQPKSVIQYAGEVSIHKLSALKCEFLFEHYLSVHLKFTHYTVSSRVTTMELKM